MKSISDQRDMIGQVLLDIGYISPDQLAEAGARQKNCPEKRLGEILIELGYISRTRLKKGLILQEMEREFNQRNGRVKKSS
jgi:hypothetical protein